MHCEIVYPKGMMHERPFMIKDYSLSQSFSAIVIWPEYLVSSRSIAQSYDLKYDPSTVEFKVREIPIDKEFSILMEDAWESVLKQTRYKDKNKNIFTLDGTSYVFGVDRLCGMTGSPKSGTTLMMINLGEQIEQLVHAEESDREKIRKKCIEMAKAIIEKTTPNQKLDPTVKTPVESGNKQGTAGQL
jgi:hypothetical protein